MRLRTTLAAAPMIIDGWDQARSLGEGTPFGLTARLQPFVLDYLRTHKR